MRRLVKYLIKRLLLAVPTLLALSLIIFWTTTFLPMDERVRLYVSPSQYQHPGHGSSTEELVVKYHLNETFVVQWTMWFREVLKGNLGYSYLMHMPVMKAISLYFTTTLEIVMYSAPIIVFVGYKLGVLSARRAHKKAPRGDIVDKIVRVASTIGYSTPAFFLGLFLILIFYTSLHWTSLGRVGLPVMHFTHSPKFTSYTGLFTVDALLNGQLWMFLDVLRHLALPVLTLTMTMVPIIVRIMRASMMGELAKPYITTARSKGLNEKEAACHAKKPSLFPVLTVSGMVTASMLTGVVVVEYIFNIRGLGYWLVEAVTRWDYPLIVGISLLFCVIFIIANLIVDVAYTYLDPRVEP